MTVHAAAAQMMDFFRDRVRVRFAKGQASRAALERMETLHALVAAYPDLPRDTQEFHVAMNFEHRESEFGGASWQIRGVQLRAGELQITTGSGNTDGMCSSDVFESPTEEIALYLSALGGNPAAMSGPYL